MESSHGVRCATDSSKVVVQEIPGKGKGVVSLVDISPGEIILQEEPALTALLCSHWSIRCHYCYSSLHPPLLKCASCKVACYCSKECQRVAWKLHKLECKAMQGATPGKAQQAGLDAAIAMARLRRLLKAETTPGGPAARFNELVTHHRELRGDELAACHESARQVARVLGIETAAGENEEEEEEEGKELVGRFSANAISVTTEALEAYAVGMYPQAGARVNHSCRPNACVSFSKRGVLRLRALEPIGAGQEVCHTYVPLTDMRSVRHSRLRAQYLFDCACVRCSDESPLSIDACLDAVICGADTCCAQLAAAPQAPVVDWQGPAAATPAAAAAAAAGHSGDSAVCEKETSGEHNETVGEPKAQEEEEEEEEGEGVGGAYAGGAGRRRRMRRKLSPQEESSEGPGTREALAAMAAQHPATGGRRAFPLASKLQRRRSFAGGEDGRPPFVAAFAQSNEGDVTPNTGGAFCLDTGLPCDFNTSTCNGRSTLCYGRGPAYPWGDHFDSTRIIAELQFHKARELFEGASEALRGPVDSRMMYLHMADLRVELPPDTPGGKPRVVNTCPAAAGFGFAGGTTDGPGAFDFTQGDSKGNLFWRFVRSFIKIPSRKQVLCQHPKPVLLDTGELNTPYAWAPSILPISIHRVGQLILLAVPAEFTTMSGRRLREAVAAELAEADPAQFGSDSAAPTRVVVAGLSNAYSQYVATFEEYQAQRYEGASTLYGPHTLSAYIQEFRKLARALASGTAVPEGPAPAALTDRQLSFLPPVVADSTPAGASFGGMKRDVPANATFAPGAVVEASFFTGCLRNDLHTEGTFVSVERLSPDGASWASVHDDDDWCLRFSWTRPFPLSTESHANVRWEVPGRCPPGVYRLRHNGAYKHLLGSIHHFTGASRAFVVTSDKA